MSASALLNILRRKLSLSPGEVQALEIELARYSRPDSEQPGRSISVREVRTSNLVIRETTGIELYNRNGSPTIQLKNNGDAKLGNDLLDVEGTSLAIFSNDQAYNGEAMGAGDVLLGNNSAGKANVIWDRSTGRLNFRGGTTVNAYIDTDGLMKVIGAVIGGWTVSATALSAGSGANTVGLDSGGSNPAIYAGSSTPGSAPFRVTQAGALTAQSGTIAGWTINTSEIKKTGVILDSAADAIYLGSGAPRLVLDGGNKRIRSSTFSSGFQGFNIDGATGNAEFNNVSIRGALHSAVMSYGELHATAGSHGVFKSAGKLRSDATTVASPTTFAIEIEDPSSGHVQLFEAGDVLQIKDGSGATNWLTVVSTTNNTTYYTYTCLLANGSPATFRAGCAVADYGPSGAGYIIQSADGAVGFAANLSILTHAGSPWSANTLQVRLGNLRGSYGVDGTTNTYGIGIGDYSAGNYLSYNAELADTLVIRAGDGAVGIDSAGVSIIAGTTYDDIREYKFVDSNGNKLGGYRLATPTGELGFEIDTAETANDTAGVIAARANGNHSALMMIVAQSAYGNAHVEAFANATRYGVSISGTTYSDSIYIGDDHLNANMTMGLTINMGSADNEIMAFKSSDVAHGMTALSETDTFALFAKASGTDGGMLIEAMTETSDIAFQLFAIAGAGTTTKSTAARAPMEILSYKKNGTTVQALGANENLLTVRNSGATRFILDGDGDSHQDVGVSWTNFDDHDDLALLNSLSAHLTRADDPLKASFGDWLSSSREPLEAMRLVTFNENGHHFVNWSRMHMLEIGAIRQLAAKLERALALLDLMDDKT